MKTLRVLHPGILINGSIAGNNVGPQVMGKAMSMGYQPGHPDLVVYAMRGGYGACFIELKAGLKSKISERQEMYINSLRKQGYFAEVCFSFDQALDMIEMYLQGKYRRENHV